MKSVFLHFLEKHLCFDASPLSALTQGNTWCFVKCGTLEGLQVDPRALTCQLRWGAKQDQVLDQVLVHGEATSQAGPQGEGSWSSVHFFCWNTPHSEDLTATAWGKGDLRGKQTNISKEGRCFRRGYLLKETEEINVRFLRDCPVDRGIYTAKQELPAISCSLLKYALLASFLHCNRSKRKFGWQF